MLMQRLCNHGNEVLVIRVKPKHILNNVRYWFTREELCGGEEGGVICRGAHPFRALILCMKHTSTVEPLNKGHFEDNTRI